MNGVKRLWLVLLSLGLIQCGSPTPIVDAPAEISLQQTDSPPTSTDPCAPDLMQANGALYRYCVPEDWIADQSDLVVFVPGYTSPFRPIEIPDEQLLVSPEGPSIPEVVTALGIAFATTSFASNGLITGEEAIPELLSLVNHFEQIYGEPRVTYLAGFSLGSVATAQLLETSPAEFDGSLLGCGPLGDFQLQIDYLGDVRVLFDYYFPEVLPGDLLNVPQVLIEEWEKTFIPGIEAAFLKDPALTQEFLQVAQIPFEGQDLEAITAAVVDVLFFNVFGLEEGIDRLGGSPYDNTKRWYRGSSSDLKLNLGVDRFRGDPEAQVALQGIYQTTGEFSIPLVTIHTLGDATVPYRQARLFRRKIRAAGNADRHRHIPSFTNGHCAFGLPASVAALSILSRQVTGELLSNPEQALPDPQDLAEYERLLREHL